MGLIKILPLKLSLEILTVVEVPIPTDKFGCTIYEILSPVSKP